MATSGAQGALTESKIRMYHATVDCEEYRLCMRWRLISLRLIDQWTILKMRDEVGVGKDCSSLVIRWVDLAS